MGLDIMPKIPVSVLVATKNEERHIERCVKALSAFDEVIVIDSHSQDKTVECAREAGADVVLFQWDGRYPKKRQWCLNMLKIKHDWVLWVDADEVLPFDAIQEIRTLFEGEPRCAGYFVKGQYVWTGRVLKHGLMNNKLALFDKRKIEFPVVDDLDIAGMGEIEGHYQPVLKDGLHHEMVGQLRHALLHYAYDNQTHWLTRHEHYAQWEAEMIRRNAFPSDPVRLRQVLKNITRTSFSRPYLTFIYSYIVKLGFLDGVRGYQFARSRKRYGHMVKRALRSSAKP
tara:strand:+ start:2338 stop:3189 length:852 start_codon:yes stop_codon:yes gene_type:complete